nr:glycine--tRNA ligase [Treponemataceae bacterium]
PFCVTVDYETILEKNEDGSANPNFNTVTLRFRDSMEQVRVPLNELSSRIHQEITNYISKY